MSQSIIGKVLNIALRSRPRGPMTEVREVEAMENKGLSGDVACRPDRGITFISSQQWAEVERELSASLPWHTRRANVLVDAASLGHLCGKTVSVGDVQVKINAETKPCHLMDRLHPGLRAALTPDCRAGVYGRIIKAGRIQVGDTIQVES